MSRPAPTARGDRPPASSSEFVLWLLSNGIKSLSNILSEVIRLAGKGIGALAEYLYHNRHVLLSLPVRILIVLKHIVSSLVDNPLTRGIGRLLTNLIFFKVSVDKTIGKGANGKAGIHTTICSCFSLLFGLLQLDSEYRLFLGLPVGSGNAASKAPDAPRSLPMEPLAPPTPLRNFTPTAAANPDTEEVHLLCSSELKDHIMRFLYTQSQATGGSFLLLNSSSYSTDVGSAARLQPSSELAFKTAHYLRERHWGMPASSASSTHQALGHPSTSLLTSPAPSELATAVPLPIPALSASGAAPHNAAAAAGAAGDAMFSDDELAGPPGGHLELLQVASNLPGCSSPQQQSPMAQHPLRRRASRSSLDEDPPAAAKAAAAAAAAGVASLQHTACSSASPAEQPTGSAKHLPLRSSMLPLGAAAAALAASAPTAPAPSASATSEPSSVSRAMARPPLPYASSARRLLQHSASESGNTPGISSSSSSLAMPSATSPGPPSPGLGLKGLLADGPQAAAAAGGSSPGSLAVPWMSPKRLSTSQRASQEDVPLAVGAAEAVAALAAAMES
jgi:hypothetical protein